MTVGRKKPRLSIRITAFACRPAACDGLPWTSGSIRAFSTNVRAQARPLGGPLAVSESRKKGVRQTCYAADAPKVSLVPTAERTIRPGISARAMS